MSAAEAIATLIARGNLTFGKTPFSGSICYFQEHYRRAVQGIMPLLLLAGLIMIGPLLVLHFVQGHWWVDAISYVVLMFGLWLLVMSLGDLAGIWRALNYTSFLALHQHDRALAGLCSALSEGRSVLLYLRDFDREEEDENYFLLDHAIVSLIGESQIVVAISNPNTDPSLRISPIPRLLSPNDQWQELVAGLIQRATRIVIAADEARGGLQYEIGQIRACGGQGKTLCVSMSDSGLPEDLLRDFPWKTPISQFLHQGPLDSVIGPWLGEHLLLTFKNEEKTKMRRVPRDSNQLRFLWARLYLLGWRSLIPRGRLSFYRKWLSQKMEFDPLDELRINLLNEERRAAERGEAVLPMMIQIGEEADGQRNEARKAFNKQIRYEHRIETAIFVLSMRKAWQHIRAGLYGRC
jgi:hypothetical protein